MAFETYADLVEHALDYLGGTATPDSLRDARRSVLQAYRALTNARPWSYLTAHGRIATAAPYETGTVAFDLTGGTYERQLTLAGGTWPEWAGLGAHLRIDDGDDDAVYAVAERRSATVLTLDPVLSPAADLAAGTSYVLYRDVYLLPADFVAGDTAHYRENFGGMEFGDAADWLGDGMSSWTSGTPRSYAIGGDARFPGRLVFRLHPYPDAAKAIDFMYTRRPRDLVTHAYTAGTATVAAGATAVTGDGTAWTAAMAGSVLRLGTARADPTSWIGASPPAAEARVVEVVSPTSLRVAEAIPATHAAVRYIISDPVDVERGAMLNALLRGVEKHLHIARSIKDKPDAFAAYDLALREAQAADSRSYQGRVMGGGGSRRMLKKDMPTDFS